MSNSAVGSRTTVTFPTDYDSILKRINLIDPLEYGHTRNYTDGAVTHLSPYISRGVISVRQVQEAVLSRGFPQNTIEKFLQELAWREYFQRVWQTRGDTLFEDIKQPQTNVAHKHMIKSVLCATTGIDAVDSSINKFYKTGYLHNHMRLYIASITCNIGNNLDPMWRKTELVNRVLLLEPSHFQRFPVSESVIEFILALSKNIPGIQWMVGEIPDLLALYGNGARATTALISKEHPAFAHYPGTKDARDWIYPHVTGYYPSFFSFWKRCKAEK